MNRKTLLRISEEYVRRMKGGHSKAEADIFVNPSKSELKEIGEVTSSKSVRWMIDTKKKSLWAFPATILHVEAGRVLFQTPDVYKKFICGDGTVTNGKIEIRDFSEDCFDNFGSEVDLEWAEKWLIDVDTRWKVETN